MTDIEIIKKKGRYYVYEGCWIHDICFTLFGARRVKRRLQLKQTKQDTNPSKNELEGRE